MAGYKVGDLANLISSSSQSNETPTNDLFTKKKKNKKRSAENEAEIVANGKEEVGSPVIKKKKKKKHSEEMASEESVSNTVTIIPVTSNGVGEGRPKKKKRKHGEENGEEKQSEATVTLVASNDTQEEPQKKKKKKKHKEIAEAIENENEATVTVVTADSSDIPSAEKEGKKRNRKKKKKSAATEAMKTTGAVPPAEKGTDKQESVNGEVKIKENTTSSQDAEAKKNKKKLKKQRRKQLKKLNRAAGKGKSKPDSDNIEPTVTLENNKDMKDKSKKEIKQEKIKERKIQSLPNQHPDAEARTIFIGNVNMETKRKQLLKLFSKYGKVEAVRIRGVAVGEQGMLKKVAHVTGQMHPSRSSVTAYVRFESTDSVTAALEANGMVLRDHHLNVDRAVNETKRELKNSVFVGNLPWEAEDEQLYQHFKACGEIDSVRIVRDKQLNSGKGFGYVNFKSSDATEVALQLAGKMFMNRPLRVARCTKKPKEGKLNDDKSSKKSNMKLGFMKKNNKLKSKNNQQTKEKTSNESEFSGAKTAELGKNKKIKKPRWNKEDRKKAAVATLLTGDKAAVQRPKFTAKKGGGNKPGGKPTGRPIAKKFGGNSGGKFGGKPGGKFGGKPGGKFGGKPGGKFGGKPGGKFGQKPGGKFGGKPGGKPFAGKP